jgi:transposase
VWQKNTPENVARRIMNGIGISNGRRSYPFASARLIPPRCRAIYDEVWGVAVDWQKLLPPKGFVVLPRRWVVERTLSWIDQQRRMSKDYERSCASGEALVYTAMIRLMTRRLARV